MTKVLSEQTNNWKEELLDWVSACQSAYYIDSTPGHRFGGLGSNLEENREALVAYVERLIGTSKDGGVQGVAPQEASPHDTVQPVAAARVAVLDSIMDIQRALSSLQKNDPFQEIISAIQSSLEQSRHALSLLKEVK